MLVGDGGGDETGLPVERLWRGLKLIGRTDVELYLTLTKTEPGEVLAESVKIERLNKAAKAILNV